jgi:lysine 2,3-aminomutase
MAAVASLPVVQSAEGGARKHQTVAPASPTKRPADWRWQLRSAVTSADALASALRLTASEMEGARRAEQQGLPIAITPYYLSLIDRSDPADPIRLQVVPDAREMQTHPGDLADPLGEEAHTVAPNLVRRYPDRVLLLVSDRCAVYCRFCTRSRMVGQGSGAISLDAMGPALAYIAAHPEVRDVIVSGGDPLAMSTDKLVRTVAAIRAIPTVETIRLATRVPVTLPMRVRRELVRALRPFHPLWVMTHFNHPREVTAQSRRACAMLADAGFPVMNQTVLLRGVNDSPETLETLLRSLVSMRVRPYYLLQMDPVRGSSHLRTPLARGVEIMRALQGRVSGIALPKLVCDTPGGKGKVVLSHDAVVGRDGKRTTLRTFRGEDVDYIDP